MNEGKFERLDKVWWWDKGFPRHGHVAESSETQCRVVDRVEQINEQGVGSWVNHDLLKAWKPASQESWNRRWMRR